VRLAILTVSDAGARGERADLSGDEIAVWAKTHGHEVVERALVADRTELIAPLIAQWCDDDIADLVLTTGGTGLSPRDVTPEATRSVLEREAPGIAERLRASVMERFPRAALSRGLAGVRARSLVVNLPGSPSGVADGLMALGAIVDHAVAIVRGTESEHAK
jgi:molybdenum cofactor synthesis domain-containing protein